MKALTLWQPWASLIAIGAKKIETRSWATPYRGPLAIHAAARAPERDEITEEMAEALGWSFPPLLAEADTLPLGAVVATCKLVACYRLTRVECEQIDDGEVAILRTLFAGAVTVTVREAAFGNYASGRLAWVLEEVKALPAPIVVPGARGLWDWKR